MRFLAGLLLISVPAFAGSFGRPFPPKLHGGEGTPLRSVMEQMTSSQFIDSEAWIRGSVVMFVDPWSVQRKTLGWPHDVFRSPTKTTAEFADGSKELNDHLAKSFGSVPAETGARWFPDDEKTVEILKKSTLVFVVEDPDLKHCFVNAFPGTTLWVVPHEDRLKAEKRVLCDDAPDTLNALGLSTQDIFEAMSYLHRSRPAEK